jgi:hypothetical protein
LAVKNCTIVSNTVTASALPFGTTIGGLGGGIYAAGALEIEHATIVGNAAIDSTAYQSYGGGIYSVYPFSLLNSIVAQNTAETNSDVAGTFTGSNNLVAVDPKLAALGDFGGPTKTMPPLRQSPALNAGGASSLAFDQRGSPRKPNGPPDIGAVELDMDGLLSEGFFIRVGRMASGAVEIKFGGTGQILANENISNLNEWKPLGVGTEIPPGSGLYRIEDTPTLPGRFYRLFVP